MLVDSHCHLNFPELSDNLPHYLAQMANNKVDCALVVATNLDNISKVVKLSQEHSNLFAAVGIHPDEKIETPDSLGDILFQLAQNDKVVAIGETGLDYYWNKEQDLSWQRNRFETHIEVAKLTNLPLVVHTREAANDTYQMLKTEKIDVCGAVIHCFTEDVVWAKKFLDLGCYISLSGIVTFKNATQIHEVAKYVPLDRILVETDAPYLAPVPFRGKLNHPGLVLHTAQFIADLRQINLNEFAQATTANFFKLFKKAYVIDG